jgi:PAS domain S-box-containing protein
VEAELQVAADLKAAQLISWHQERMGDARALAATPNLPQILANLTAGRASPERREELRRWLASFARIYNYQRAGLLEATMAPVLTGSDGIAPDAFPPAAELRAAAGGRAEAVMLPPYADKNGELGLDFFARLPGPAGQAPIGAVLLQSKPSQSILRVLQAWPYGNQTGQFVLWRRAGRQLYSLGGYRAAAGLADADRRPFSQVRDLDNPKLLITRGAVGETGLLEGTDVRGIPIVGMGRLIPGTDWLLTCRIDASEVYAPLRRSAWQIVGMTMLVFGGAGFFLTRRLRQRQLDLLRDRIVAELAQKRTAARLGAVMAHARDVMLILSADLRIVEANQCAVATYGWSAEELCAMPVRDLRSAASQTGYEQAATWVRQNAGGNFETEHRRKDGSVFPVEASTTQVEIDGQPHYFSIIRDITERKRAEAALRASEERYRLIAENTSDVIWLYDLATNGFSYVSPSIVAQRGYRPEELLGQPLTFSLPADAARRVSEALAKEFAVADAPGRRNFSVEIEQRHKDGRPVPTEVVASLLRDASGRLTHLLGITRDITERKRAREALEKFNTELEERVEERAGEIQALLGAIPDTVLQCNEQGAVVFARSVRYPGVAGLVTGEATAASRPELDAALRDIVREMRARALREKQAVVQEFECPVEAGRLVWLEARAAPMENGRVLLLLREISARKRHELGVQVNLERERQLSEMKSQFISVASHEFRTPLAAAVGTLELLERHAAKLTEAKRVELIARIQRSLGRLTEIMNDVLQLSRADSGRVKAVRMNADLVRLAQDILHEVESGDGRKHRFVFEPTGGPPTVPVDTKLTHHILSNLAGNAVRYSPPDTTVTVKLHIDATAFTFTVADEGIGIPEAEREHIFEPFARGSNVGQISGTGLGLNIVKRYTELMGGTIELLPMERGTTFKVRIPLAQPPA